ncbi:hypothetical protein FACS1894198_4740 [Clostridia bacterium]|nr:hypothetical protein FACS1894198_4740 [Clostridia bacterium]
MPNNGMLRVASDRGLDGYGSNALCKLGFSGKAMQAGMASAAENGSNMNTEGYSRRYLSLTSDSVRGVKARLLRASDPFAVAAIRDDSSLLEYDKSVHETLSILEQKIVNQTDPLDNDPIGAIRTNTIGGALDGLKAALSNLQTMPNDVGMKTAVREAAQKLVSAVKQTYAFVVEAENRLKENVKNKVERINELLKTIGELNRDIARSEGSGGRLHSLEDRRDVALKELSGYIPIDVQHKTVEVNGFQMRVCEVFLKGERGLSQPGIPAGGADPLVVDGNRMLVNRKGETMTFFCEDVAGGARRVEALAIGVQDVAGGGNRIGRPGGQYGLVGPAAGLAAFTNFLQRNSNLGGSLVADLNLLRGQIAGDALKTAPYRCIPEYKTLLNQLVNGTAGGGVNGLVHEFNTANIAAATAAAAGGPPPPPVDLFVGAALPNFDFNINPLWAQNVNLLSSNDARALFVATEAPTAIRFGGNAGPQMTFTGFYNRMADELGRHVRTAKNDQKVHDDKLEADKNRRDEASSVDMDDEYEDMAKYQAVNDFIHEARRVMLYILFALSAALMRDSVR